MLTKNQLGFLYMFLSVCTFSVMDLLVKWSSEYPTGEVLFFRGFFGLLPTYFLIPKNKLIKRNKKFCMLDKFLIEIEGKRLK